MVRILSSVRTAVSALERPGRVQKVHRHNEPKSEVQIYNPSVRRKPQRGEQASKQYLNRHQDEEDGHPGKARQSDGVHQQQYHGDRLQGADPQEVQVQGHLQEKGKTLDEKVSSG